MLLLTVDSQVIKKHSSGAINPARDLGPRLFSLIKYGSAAMTDNAYFFWIPLFAPLVGGVSGAILYHVFIAAHWEDEEDKACLKKSQNLSQISDLICHIGDWLIREVYKIR